MDTPGITVAPLEMINGVREFAEVFFDDVVVPADRDARRGQRRLGRRDEHPPVRALVVLLAAHRVPLPAARAARRGRARRRAQRRGRRRRVPAAPRAARPLARSRSTGSPAGETLGAETSIDKVLVATARARDLRRGAPPAARRRRDRRRRRGRDVAHRVPLLTRRDDLRRHRRGAAQHHRPPPARPREPTT